MKFSSAKPENRRRREIITQEIYDKLVALNLVSETGLEGSLMPMLGSLVITGMLFAALYLFFRWGKGIFS